MGGYAAPITFNSGSRKGVDQGLQQQSGNLASQAAPTLAQRSRESGSLLPGYQSMLDSGYSDPEKSAIEQGTTGAISSSYGAAGDSAARRMATTNNSAGYGSMLGALARGKAKDVALQEGQNQVAFAAEKQRRKEAGLAGIASLYGVDTSFLNSLNQGQNQLLGQSVGTYGIAKGHPGFLDSLSSSAGSGLGQLLTLH
jgi:hypothetical protein